MATDGGTDLAGHERYLKTTLYGLTSGSPSCVILIVGGNAGLIGMSKEHLAISLALSVPVAAEENMPAAKKPRRSGGASR